MRNGRRGRLREDRRGALVARPEVLAEHRLAVR